MTIIDCHLHSGMSLDSREDMENYIKLAVENGDKYFITTEHANIIDDKDDPYKHMVAIETIKAKTDEMRQKYAGKIDVLFGIEIGWMEAVHDFEVEFSHSQPFDMIILALHGRPAGETVDQRFDNYLAQCCQAAANFGNYDTFAHTDYVLRYIGHTDLAKHKEKLTQLFTTLISQGKALEINTKQLPDPQAIERMEYMLQLYTSLGGKKLTIGSDAHSVPVYKNGFDTAIEIIKKYGINQVYLYKQRKEIAIAI